MTILPKIASRITIPAALLLLGTIFLLIFITNEAKAQSVSLGISNYLSIKDEKVEDGDIVASLADGYHLADSKTPNQTLVGVVSSNAAISLVSSDKTKKPVVSSGNVLVNVSGENGAIKKGDKIAPSSVPGVGAKADKAGFVLGSANEDFSPSSATDSKKINVSLNVHYYTTNSKLTPALKDILTLSFIASTDQPSVIVKYLVAAGVLFLCLGFAFLFFGKLALSGVEALGRNPKAGRIIQFGIFLNVTISIVIILSGVAIGFLIIRI